MTLRRFLYLSLPATAVAGLLSATLVEVWVRAQWDNTRGAPGFFLSDPVRGNRLAAGYDGWFAGVPVRINSLGFRDSREYDLHKGPGTFRILVLGDSVTFGHGAVWETTYPFLVEQRLKGWRPHVNWQVWNLGVPGYNTAQELAYLTEVGPRFAPDLVIAGFYANDLVDNHPLARPSMLRRAASALQRTMQRHLYSYEFYKRAFLTLRFTLMTSDADRQRLQNLAGEDALLVPGADLSTRDDQKPLPVDTYDDEQVQSFHCPGEDRPRTGQDRLATTVRGQSPDVRAWIDAVRGFQKLNSDGTYRVMFFINMAPAVCADADRFIDGGSFDDDQALREVMEDGTPVASSVKAFLHVRPSQMPGAGGHSFGNSNRVKADALFDFLRTDVLPPLMWPTPSER